jgi:hypothetical protein
MEVLSAEDQDQMGSDLVHRQIALRPKAKNMPWKIARTDAKNIPWYAGCFAMPGW